MHVWEIANHEWTYMAHMGSFDRSSDRIVDAAQTRLVKDRQGGV